MDSRNSSGIESRNFYFATVQKLFSKIFSRSGKCIMWSSIQVLPNQVSKNPSKRLRILAYESSMQKLHKKPSEALGADRI